MKRRIDAAPELANWTHRDPDDPAIALMQGAAVLGDILSFYQEHYANEAFLRTAAWRQSIAELVRLTGYRLAPGIRGRATFAFEVRGAQPVTLRAGFPVKADLKDVSAPAEFQTLDELIAWPHLGRFNLYRPRQYGLVIGIGQAQLEVATVGGVSSTPYAVRTQPASVVTASMIWSSTSCVERAAATRTTAALFDHRRVQLATLAAHNKGPPSIPGARVRKRAA
jgi:hypothetical protein